MALLHDWSLWARPNQLFPHEGWWNIWMLLAGRGFGKSLALDTQVPTPEGLKLLGDIQTGDLVYSPDGTVTRVTMSHPVRLNRNCYRVTFDNGQSVIADEEHLWATVPREQRRRPKEAYKSVHTTLEIRNTLRRGSTVNHFIPSTKPLIYPYLDLPLDPYCFGYWLGDGSSKQWRFTILKEDLNHFESKLPYGYNSLVSQDKSPNCFEVKVSNGSPSSRDPLGRYESNDSLQSQLKYLSVYKNKHIPQQYLTSSIEQRLELLRGLMDSDGSVNKRGNQASFYSTNTQLADDVYHLLSSLGYVVSRGIKLPKITGKPEAVCQPCHILRIRPRRELNPFSLPRKRDRVATLANTQSSRLGGRFIVSVDPVPSVPVRCLTVDHPSKLYLITPDCIPTHNTRSGAEAIRHLVDTGHRRIALIAPTSGDARDVMVEGEALALDTPIPTPTGWTTISKLSVGDSLYSADGSITTVIAKSPVFHNRPCFAIETDLASPIVADANHLWVTRDRNDRRQGYLATQRTTLGISQTLRKPGGWNHAIELPSTLQSIIPDSALPIPPYTLGAWLGDGDTRGKGQLCQHPKDISTIERIESEGFEVSKQKATFSWYIKGLARLLKANHLPYNKHIPEIYMRASSQARIELVRGLMDTDGNVSERGQCQFSNTNLALVQSLRELLLTLGYKPGAIQVRGIERNPLATKVGYRLSFKRLPGTPSPFHMPRKSERTLSSPTSLEATYRLIKGATPLPPQATQCIQVAHPSGMFLAGLDFIPTHNSGLLAISPPWNRPTYEPSKRRLTWPNGAQAFMYSAEEPERLRGPQHDAGWLDELAAWQYPQETWDMYQFGLRLGKNPRTVITTTPKPIPLVRALLTREGKDVIVSRGSTYENRENLAPSFFNQVAQYEGTRLGRQELHAELIDPSESGIIKRSWFKLWPANKPLPYFEYIVQSYDTAFTEQTMDKKTKDPDPSACTVWGIFRDPSRKNAATPYSVMILDAWSDWMEYPTLRAKAITEAKASFGPVDAERKVDLLLIEDKGSGISLRQDLARVVPIHAYNPGRSDKVARLHLVSNLFINGLVYLPESPNHPTKPRTWAEPFLEQITSFPQVVHDDYVDTASQALQFLSDSGWLAVDILEKPEYDDDNTAARVNPYAT